jgi:hypothetical protein
LISEKELKGTFKQQISVYFELNHVIYMEIHDLHDLKPVKYIAFEINDMAHMSHEKFIKMA